MPSWGFMMTREPGNSEKQQKAALAGRQLAVLLGPLPHSSEFLPLEVILLSSDSERGQLHQNKDKNSPIPLWRPFLNCKCQYNPPLLKSILSLLE